MKEKIKFVSRRGKFKWIRELHAVGLKPILNVLCRCPKDESYLYEHRYFKLYNYNDNLLNTAVIQKETYQMTLKI